MGFPFPLISQDIRLSLLTHAYTEVTPGTIRLFLRKQRQVGVEKGWGKLGTGIWKKSCVPRPVMVICHLCVTCVRCVILCVHLWVRRERKKAQQWGIPLGVAGDSCIPQLWVALHTFLFQTLSPSRPLVITKHWFPVCWLWNNSSCSQSTMVSSRPIWILSLTRWQ